MMEINLDTKNGLVDFVILDGEPTACLSFEDFVQEARRIIKEYNMANRTTITL